MNSKAARMYHPCIGILIQGLKKLPGGDEVLTEWDKARARVDAEAEAGADPVRAREILAHVIATEEAKGYAGRFGKDQKHVPEWAALEAIAAALAQQPAAVDEAIRAAVLAEREACAKACDDRAAYYHDGDDDGPNTRRGIACEACASAIRWRSTVPASFLAKHEASIEELLSAQQQGGRADG